MTTYGLAFEIILENTIIENRKGCFIGKIILDDLRKRLERLDEDADLMIDNNDRYQMVIVGGSAFILLGKLLEGMAEYYSAELSEKVIRGQTENALKGKCTGGTGTIDYKIDDDKFYHLDPLTAPLVLEAFQRYDNGDKMVEIVNFLNDKGVRNMLGGKMTHSSVNTMLKNRRFEQQNGLAQARWRGRAPTSSDLSSSAGTGSCGIAWNTKSITSIRSIRCCLNTIRNSWVRDLSPAR